MFTLSHARDIMNKTTSNQVLNVKGIGRNSHVAGYEDMTAMLGRFHLSDLIRELILSTHLKVRATLYSKVTLQCLRGSDCKYRESADKLKKSKILITCQKNTFGELSSKILLKPSGILLFSINSEKTVWLN